MRPLTFSCVDTLALPPAELARRILDLTNWPDFNGFGPIPGIRSAEFEVRTPEIVGTRVRVTNRDGSNHVEEIVEWQPDARIRLEMKDFSAPLSRLATGIEETWEFTRTADATRAVRSFTLHPKSTLTRPLLSLIAVFLKKAIARHLREMALIREQTNEDAISSRRD